MKLLRRALGLVMSSVVLLGISPVDFVIAQETNRSNISRLQAIYTNNIQKLDDKYNAQKTNLPSAYDKELAGLEVTLAKKGNLDGVLAVQKEKERRKLGDAILIPDSAVVQLPAELNVLQEKYRNFPKVLIAEHNKEYVSLSNAYIAHLEKVKASLTKNMKIAEAIEYKNEIENINGILAAAFPKEPVKTNVVVAVSNTVNVVSNQVAMLPVNDKLDKPSIVKEEPVQNIPTNSIVVDLGDNIKIQFAFIPSGEFWMGSTNKEDKSRTYGEKTPIDYEFYHKVKLTKNYWMGIYEVTQEQYEKIMGNNPSKLVGSKLPVESVSWFDCQKFTEIMNKRLLEFKITKGYCFRLPTEAEWEYACRAGTTTRFYTGDEESDFDKAGWPRNAPHLAHPGGEKVPNNWGLYDMHGNVSEWCLDWAGEYDRKHIINPTGASSGNCRIVRGSVKGVVYSRSGARGNCFGPDVKDDQLGFRIVIAPKL